MSSSSSSTQATAGFILMEHLIQRERQLHREIFDGLDEVAKNVKIGESTPRSISGLLGVFRLVPETTPQALVNSVMMIAREVEEPPSWLPLLVAQVSAWQELTNRMDALAKPTPSS